MSGRARRTRDARPIRAVHNAGVASDGTADASDDSHPALAPAPPGVDPDWRRRIEIAKRMREETRNARRDKPATFDMRGPPIKLGE